MTKTAERISQWSIRLVVLLAAIALGSLICFNVRRFWGEYWVARDPRQTTAVLLQTHPRRVFDYRYTVDGTEYTGSSSRDWEDVKSHPADIGGSCAVNYSTSHPWLSSLRVESIWYVVGGMPFLVLFLLVEFYLIVVIAAPNSKWVARLIGNRG